MSDTTSVEPSYRLEITRRISNPQYDPKQAGYPGEHVDSLLTLSDLSITITETQFQAIRKAVLEVF